MVRLFAGRYRMGNDPTKSAIRATFPPIELMPVVKLNFKARTNRF
jgi:hypothetical protein